MTVKVVKPVEITDALLLASSLPSSSAPAWTPVTTYSAAVRVQVGKRIYASVQAGNLGHDPTQDADETWWINVSPTNRWAMFDQEINTQSIATSSAGAPVSITVTIGPVLCNTLGLLELLGNELEITVMDGSGSAAQQVYHRVINLDNTTVADWYQYFFEPATRTKEVFLEGLPPYGSAVITVTLRGQSEVRIGSLVLGTTYSLGALNWGARMGINDFSRKSTNDFGVTTLVKRQYSKRAEIPLTLDTENLARVHGLLADLRSTVCIWLGSDDPRLSPLNILGFYKEFSIDMRVANLNFCTLSLEGMI
jgi:hypothetical protein